MVPPNLDLMSVCSLAFGEAFGELSLPTDLPPSRQSLSSLHMAFHLQPPVSGIPFSSFFPWCFTDILVSFFLSLIPDITISLSWCLFLNHSFVSTLHLGTMWVPIFTHASFMSYGAYSLNSPNISMYYIISEIFDWRWHCYFGNK